MQTHSDSLDMLAPDLVAAQAELQNVVATETAKIPTGGGTEYTYKYCDLAAVRDTIVPVFARHGLAVTQPFVPRPEAFVAERVTNERQREVRTSIYVFGHVQTLLLHKSGQWILSEIPLAGDWGDPRKLGSAITYLRRYSLSAIAGLAQVDDDGRDAMPPIGRVEHGARGATNGHGPSNGYAPRNGPAPAPRQAQQPAREPGDDEPFDETEQPILHLEHPEKTTPADARSASLADRKAAYNERFGPPPVAASQHAPEEKEASVPLPNFGKGGFYGWLKDNNLTQWFQELGDANRLPRQFRDWSCADVAWAYSRYELACRQEPSGNGRR